MLNAEPPRGSADQGETLARVVASGPVGAAVVAGLATAIVLAIWFAFYLFVFVPRSLP